MKLRPAMIELVVSDMSTTLAFYRLLGLDIPPGADNEQHVVVELGGGISLGFDTEVIIKSYDSAWTPPADGGHRVALAFECDSAAEVDAAWTEMTTSGYRSHLEPWNAVWGMRYAILRDPDGNSVDLFAQLP